MQILLINTNPVVSRLITLCIRDKEINLLEVASIEDINVKHFDILFIDDDAFSTISEETLASFQVNKSVLFSKEMIENPPLIDEVIKKPFLPSQITQIIKEVPASAPPIPQDSHEETPDEEVTFVESEANSNEILDLNEIEKIKSLLDMDENEDNQEPIWEDDVEYERRKRDVIKQNLIDEGLEIVEEDDVIHALEEKSDLSLNITHNVDGTSRSEFERKLLDAVKKMKIKKIKKLLKGADITINIRFKDQA